MVGELKLTNVAKSLSHLAKLPSLAVAVSAGVDSMVLLHIIACWHKNLSQNSSDAHLKESICKVRSVPEIIILTVNHHLRAAAETLAEQKLVQQAAKEYGFAHYTLSWALPLQQSNLSNLQAQARAARYQLMARKCQELNISVLLTAHHADDMLETYLMQQDKKAGVLGCSSAVNFFYQNIHVQRPLSNYGKQQLIDYALANELDWLEDASNLSLKYTRNQYRQKIAGCTAQQKAQWYLQLTAINDQAKQQNQRLILALAQLTKINNYGYAELDLVRYLQEPAEIQLYVLNYLLTIISGKQQTPRFRNVSLLLEQLRQQRPIDSTLHGARIKQRNHNLYILREAGQINDRASNLGHGWWWDERFLLIGKLPEKSSINKLTYEDYLSIKQDLDFVYLRKQLGECYKLLLFTLPVIKKLEKVIAIPHISYYNNSEINELKFVFRPDFISRFTHFL